MSEERTRAAMMLEDLFILLSVFALWPGILGWDGAVWQVLKYAAVVGLICILVRRMRRYKARKEGTEK